MTSLPLAASQFDNDPQPLVRPGIGLLRLLIGLAQGVVLYWLYHALLDKQWPATVPMLFTPLVLAMVLCPVLLGACIGHLAPRRAAMWVGAATLLVALLGAYEGWRHVVDAGAQIRPPSPLLFVHLAAALFIAHTLVLAASAEGRRIASYAAYFDLAWKLAVQLVFSAGFTVATWLVLNLGGALFKLIGLVFLNDMLGKAWFNIPVLVFAFTCAMHITDVRPAIVRGIRSLLLVLMSWLLPVATVLIGGFLASTLATGLAPLWATRHAAASLLGAAGVLVMMINAAWQNGDAFSMAAAPVRWSARLSAMLLMPLVLIAAWALALRVGAHGWTDERLVAAATTVVAACYAGGYLAAALQRGDLRRIAAVNTATAFVVIAVIVALFSPALDPARISVNSQLARLAAGAVSAERFDYGYLRFSGERYGRDALAALAVRTAGADADLIRRKAASAIAVTNRFGATVPPSPGELQARVKVWPAGTVLPANFFEAATNTVLPWSVPACMRQRDGSCEVFAVTADGTPPFYIVLSANKPASVPASGAIVRQGADGRWAVAATLPMYLANCPWYREQLIAGHARGIPALRQDIEIGGVRVESSGLDAMRPPPGCPGAAKR